MGLQITCVNDKATIPRETVLTLTCDGHHNAVDLFGGLIQDFAGPGFISQYSAAMRAGWKDTCNERGERVFLGPCCSGKEKR